MRGLLGKALAQGPKGETTVGSPPNLSGLSLGATFSSDAGSEFSGASPNMKKVMNLLGGKGAGPAPKMKLKKKKERKIDMSAMVEGFPGVRAYDIKTAFDNIDVDRGGFLAAQEIRHF